MSGVDFTQVTTGDRVRVVFEGTLSALAVGPAGFGPIPLLNAEGKHAATLERPVVVSVETVQEPLPTEPGTRFWGSLDKTAPCWWFVTKERGTEGVWYVSQHGTRDRHPSGAHSTSIVATEGRLVRLPDPEVTP